MNQGLWACAHTPTWMCVSIIFMMSLESSGKRCLCSDKYIAKHLEFGTGDSKMKDLRETAELNANEGAPKSEV